MKRFRQGKKGGTMKINRLLAALVLGVVIAGCAPSLPKNPPITEARWLDQNWSDGERFWFHHATQGTSTLPVPYDWFLALEQPKLSLFGDPPLLKDSDYLRRFGFIPSPPSLDADNAALREYGYGSGYGTASGGRKYGTKGIYDREAFPGNPDGLPVGFARTTGYKDPTTGEELPDQIGLTCAACHTGQLEYNGVSLRVDGGPAVTDLGKFRETLGLSLAYTDFVPFRFGRFADRVLGENHTPEESAALKKQLNALIEKGKALNKDYGPVGKENVEEGFARLDALNRIGNQVFFQDLLDSTDKTFDPRANIAALSAPVNFPHIWDTSWFKWVQYDASIEQPMVRNAGEAMGVSARVNMVRPGPTLYDSSVKVREIFHMENLLAGDNPLEGTKAFKGLRAPKWPQDVLGAIDETKRKEGEKLYRQLCQDCHLPPVNDPSGRFWARSLWTTPNKAGESYLNLKEIPITYLGTDPGQALVIVKRTVNIPSYLGVDLSGACNGDPGGVLTQTSFAMALGSVVEKTVEKWYDNNGIPDAERQNMNGNRSNCLQAKMIYKARPLDGIWATAPYLHNGSVPNLWALLSPVDERPKEFCLGSRQFDPKNVGYETTCVEGAFKLDTTIRGNLNTGHEFKDGLRGNGVIGRSLRPEERRALIEFLKSL
jgi:hypothetical protein